jgi:endonuclease YncB( thermonuclease family)
MGLSICAPGPRDNCVVDGDTFWVQGMKVRIADIDAPEVSGRCEYERRLAIQSRNRLLELLNAGAFQIHPKGEDRYGRTLAVVTRNGRSLGDRLVSEGLARTWTGRREPWC